MTTNPNMERDVRHQRLFDKYHRGDRHALEMICAEVYLMVCKMSMDAVKGNESHPLFEDYFAAAQYAVVKAAQKYDKDRGVAWPTYARWQIRSAMNHEHVRQQAIRNRTVNSFSIDDMSTHHTTDDDNKDWYLIPDPTKFEQDFEERWSVMDFMKSCNLTEEQKAVVYGLLEGDTYAQIGEDIGHSESYVSLMVAKNGLREMFRKYLEDAKKIYRKPEELNLG